MLVVPIPRLRVDRLAHAAKDAQGAEVVVLDMVRAEAAQEADGGGRGVELRDFVLGDGFPVARGRGVDGCGFEDGGGDAVGEGAVDDVSVCVATSGRYEER